MSSMRETIAAAGDFAHGGDVDGAAQDWMARGFTPASAAEWLAAGCFEASAAAKLAARSVTPEQAAGPAPNGDRIGYAVSNGDLSVAEAVALVA